MTANSLANPACHKYFYCNISNWGDQLNPYLTTRIARNTKPFTLLSKDQLLTYEHYICIGSIAQWATGKSCLWGTGSFMFPRRFRFADPSFKCALVRGPLTRRQLISRGVDCPELYGDPGLLISRFYRPRVEKKYELGIIPHHNEIKDGAFRFDSISHDKRVKVIDITQSVEEFVNDLLACEVIASSALHGLIAAHAYAIPSVWFTSRTFKVGTMVNHLKGVQHFKYHDYYQGIDRTNSPVVLSTNPSAKDVARLSALASQINLDLHKVQNQMLLVCPFADPK